MGAGSLFPLRLNNCNLSDKYGNRFARSLKICFTLTREIRRDITASLTVRSTLGESAKEDMRLTCYRRPQIMEDHAISDRD
jgi:hypothetical protein